MEEVYRFFENKANKFKTPASFTGRIEDAINKDFVLFSNMYESVQMILNSIPTDLSIQDKVKLAINSYFFNNLHSCEFCVIFESDSNYANHVYQAFEFLTLCRFLNSSKRASTMPLKEFVGKHSLHPAVKIDREENYSVRDNKNDVIDTISTAVRKYRNNLFVQRPNYYNSEQWKGMSLSSETEWSLWFKLQHVKDTRWKKDRYGVDVERTFRRICNLNNEINLILNGLYKGTVSEGYKQYRKKLSKLSIDDYVSFCQFAIENISEDSNYYGINLYRLERQLKYYSYCCEIKQLISIPDEGQKAYINSLYSYYDEVVFPNVAQDIVNAENDTGLGAMYLSFFKNLETIGVLICLLALDELIEKGQLGDDWESIFCTIINQNVCSVLYEPSSVQYPTGPESQKAFEYIHVQAVLNAFRSNGIEYIPDE